MHPGSYDIAIIGGGLAGLALSIQSARAGYSVVLLEKEKYPFHRVCGEYISFESWNFLQELGAPLSDMQLPLIRQLLISSPSGKSLQQSLPLGGFGISRYMIDRILADIARKEGVILLEETKATDITFAKGLFTISSSQREIKATIAAGCFGKRSNLDIKWKRRFADRKKTTLDQYIGVKYHVHTQHPAEQIAIHNFENGYCGISQVEDNKYCLCYLTTAENLRKNNNDIGKMEQTILMKNPYLEKIFRGSDFLYKDPLTISQISFNKKTQVENHALMIGDSAGMITPLCGNGMSIALHSSKLAFTEMLAFLQGKINRYEMEIQYEQEWERYFGRRLYAGRLIQRFFGNEKLTNALISGLKPFPAAIRWLIRQTHGEPF